MLSKYKTYPLGNFIEQIRGVSYKKSDVSEVPKEGYIPLLRANNIQAGKLVFSDVIYVKKELVRDSQLIKKGDIVIAASSGSKEVVGKSGQAHSDYDCSFGAFCKLIRAKENINPRFLGYFFKTDYYSSSISNSVNGANINNLRNEHIDNLLIPIPSVSTQEKIANVLDKAQELIDKRKAQIEALDQLTQSVFLEMFGDPVKNSLGFKTEPLHELCVHIFGGGTPSKSNPEYYIGNIPWVTPKDMKDIVINDSIDHINEDAIANSSAKLIPPNSLLMVIRSGILKKKLPIAINTREVTVNQDMKAFVVDKNKITVEYLLYFFEFYQKVLLNRVRSVTADNLDFQQIKEILVPVPPINKQKEFSNIFYKVLAEKNKCLQQLNELENNFNSLMQRAFKGELFND